VFSHKPSRKKLYLNPYKQKSRKRRVEWKRGFFRKKRTLASPRIYLATPRFRARESSGHLQRKIAFFLFLLALGSLVYFLFFFPFWQIKEIVVVGNVNVKGEDVEKLARENLKGRAFIFPKENLIIAGKKHLSSVIYDHFAQIEKIDIKKEFPDVLKITITEREPKAIWANGAPQDLFLPPEAFASDSTSREEIGEVKDKESQAILTQTSYPENPTILYYFLDAEGRIGEEIPEETVWEKGLPVLYDQSFKKVEPREQILDPSFLRFLFQVQDLLSLKTDLKVQEFIVPISDSRDLYIKTDKGYQIFFDTKQSLQNQLEALTLVFKEDIGKNNKEIKYYIDLRVQGLVYYK